MSPVVSTSSLNVLSRSGGLGTSVAISEKSKTNFNDEKHYSTQKIIEPKGLTEKQYISEQQRLFNEQLDRERTIADQRAFAEQKSLAQQKLIAAKRSQENNKLAVSSSSEKDQTVGVSFE